MERVSAMLSWLPDGLKEKRLCSPFRQLRCWRLDRYAAMVSHRFLMSIMSASSTLWAVLEAAVKVTCGIATGGVKISVESEESLVDGFLLQNCQ